MVLYQACKGCDKMLKSNLENILSFIGPSTIEKMSIDIPKDKISIDITTTSNTRDNKYKLVFEEVFSFYYVNSNGSLEKSPLVNSTQLNSIIYYKDGIGEFINIDRPIEELTDEDIALPNFALELLDSSMFIEARSIRINDKRFRVGYPSI